jgi:hypothetical protein
MATTTAKKTGFKESVKNTGTKVKNYASKKYQSAKEYGRKYKDDIRTAYDVGYSRGWDDAYDIPDRFGAKFAAGIGYRKGVKNRKKSDKYIKQYNKQAKPVKMEG